MIKKKDYVAIGQAVKDALDTIDFTKPVDNAYVKMTIANQLGLAFNKDNEKFNWSRFYTFMRDD